MKTPMSVREDMFYTSSQRKNKFALFFVGEALSRRGGFSRVFVVCFLERLLDSGTL